LVLFLRIQGAPGVPFFKLVMNPFLFFNVHTNQKKNPKKKKKKTPSKFPQIDVEVTLIMLMIWSK